MRRILLSLVGLAVAALAAWLALAPVPVEPVAWDAPADRGHTGAFALDSLLSGAAPLPLAGMTGPESVARDAQGRLYVSVREGAIVRLDPDGTHPVAWARTGGRPLGLDFGLDGTLYVADGVRGLLAVDTAGTVRVVADRADGTRLEFADDVAVAADGRVYFSDASTKFGARARTDEDASVLDVIEHGGHGRLVEWDPATGRATVVLAGLDFANGVAMLPGDTAVLLAETGAYRVLRVGVRGAARGVATPVLENLPGFPDNISRNADGTYWLALFAPRNALVDRLSTRPALRKVLLRIPAWVRPRPAAHSEIVRLTADGRVLDDRHDPLGRFPKSTDVLETPEWLFVGSLQGAVLARLPR